MPCSGFAFFRPLGEALKCAKGRVWLRITTYTAPGWGSLGNLTELSGNYQVVIPTSFIIRAVAEGRISFHSLLGRNTPLHRKQAHMLDADKRKEAHRENLQRGRKGAFLLQLRETQHHRAMLVVEQSFEASFKKHNFNPLPHPKSPLMMCWYQ